MTFGVWKPWFLYRPQQIVRRLLAGVRPPASAFSAVDTSWGARVIVDPTRAIGRSIATTGLFDLTVSEVLARLIDVGDTVIDAGAHVGYMTVLAATAAGRGGRVLAFEPHPERSEVVRLLKASGYRLFAIGWGSEGWSSGRSNGARWWPRSKHRIFWRRPNPKQ